MDYPPGAGRVQEFSGWFTVKRQEVACYHCVHPMSNGHVKPPPEWQDAVRRALESQLLQKSPKLKDLLA